MSRNKEIINDAIDKACDIESIKDEIIYDVDNFKRELEKAGHMTDELEDFIENYMRWDND